MAVLALERVSLAFDHLPLLDNVLLQVEAGERLALVGRNGSGKSTLLKLLAGAVQPDAGVISRTHALRMAYVPQEPVFPSADTVTQVVTQALGPVGVTVAAYQHTAAALTTATGAEAKRLLAQLHALQTQLEHGDGWRLQTHVETVLTRLQLPPEAPLGQLSSGWQRRVSLAQALVRHPELLLLDEPTNHLDLAAIDWLEQYITGFDGTLVFVTHDRVFLDRLATGIVELDRGQLRRFSGAWTAYRAHKQALLEVEDTQAEQFDKRLAQEEAWVRQGIRARRTRNEGRVRRLLQMRETRAARREILGQATFALNSGAPSGQLVVEIDQLSKAYGEQAVVQNFSTRIMRGDRIGLVGPNGIGKSTLLRLILGELQPDSGRVRHGTRLSIAYFDQRREQLDPEATLWETVCPNGGDTVTVGGTARHVVSYLAEFLFPPHMVRGRVKSLSGGERNRLLLARLFTRPANLLVLDEPTNDLDVDTLELLEGLLVDYDGTLLLASHDRAFLDGVVTSLYAFEGKGRVREYVGGYSDWRQASQPRSTTAPRRRPAPPVKKPRQGLTYLEQRELTTFPERIEALEHEQTTLHAQLADPDLFHRDPTAFQTIMERLAALEEALPAAYARWEELELRQ
ncbi:MAG: ATP-binding cassette domain-containing protein [Candidatus Tectomicrobia bacterium]|uniref:ATP-binding protein Uup n=1 Tax=Tectimicrobiota bacterium TaxID=2528274 RepID=A0A938B588_UNCTE|nr:ATP-binding cassette domain-containing protein [Candidatus Tectomicrobia bacterium]